MLNAKEMMKRNEKIVNLMIKNNRVIIDNHTGEKETIVGLVEFEDPTKGLACMFNARYYSLNAALVRNDEIHCSQASIGGVLWGIPDSKQLKEYNDSQIFNSSKIKCCHMLDGTTIIPEDDISLIEVLSKNNGMIINDHTDKQVNIVGLVEFEDPTKGMGCMFNTSCYCINAAYYDDEDEMIHCSMRSIGDVLYGNTPKDLAKYNEYNSSKIKCCHMLDGATVYPAVV